MSINEIFSIYNHAKSLKNVNELPYYPDKKYYIIFYRGFFEKNGNISKITVINNNLMCEINSKDCKNILKCLKDFFNLKTTFFDEKNGYLCYSDNQALNFLFSLYDNSDYRIRNQDFYNTFLEWVNIRNLKNMKFQFPKCKFMKADPLAIIPTKRLFTDIGYDITIIKKICNIDENTCIYDTGLIVIPEITYYIKIISSLELIEKGYILSNPMILNNDSNSNLVIYLTKIHSSIRDLELPFSVGKLILEQHVFFDMLEE